MPVHRAYLRLCAAGHSDAVFNYLNTHNPPDDTRRRGFYLCCLYGHQELVERFVARGIRFWFEGVLGSCRGGHPTLFEYIIARKPTIAHNTIETVCMARNLAILEVLLKYNHNHGYIFKMLCYYGTLECIHHMVRSYTVKIHIGIRYAIRRGRLDVVMFLNECGMRFKYEHVLLARKYKRELLLKFFEDIGVTRSQP
jgi:hypothetical protein